MLELLQFSRHLYNLLSPGTHTLSDALCR